jgi:DNA-directed RNA polymerase subunit RPC12/RpoP
MDYGDPECCSCLYIVARDHLNEYRCTECDAVIAPEAVPRAIIEMESTSETCPHCGHVNAIEGFSKVTAYTCRHCERGVDVHGN